MVFGLSYETGATLNIYIYLHFITYIYFIIYKSLVGERRVEENITISCTVCSYVLILHDFCEELMKLLPPYCTQICQVGVGEVKVRVEGPCRNPPGIRHH